MICMCVCMGISFVDLHVCVRIGISFSQFVCVFFCCVCVWKFGAKLNTKCTFVYVPLVEFYVPCIYSHGRWSYHRRFTSVIVSHVCWVLLTRFVCWWDAERLFCEEEACFALCLLLSDCVAWQVKTSGVLDTMDPQEKKVQEVSWFVWVCAWVWENVSFSKLNFSWMFIKVVKRRNSNNNKNVFYSWVVGAFLVSVSFIEPNLCSIVCHVLLGTRLVKGLNWTNFCSALFLAKAWARCTYKKMQNKDIYNR